MGMGMGKGMGGPSPGPASTAPAPMSGSGSNSLPDFRKEVKTTSVFVGSIAAGITDEVLQNLLNVSLSFDIHLLP